MSSEYPNFVPNWERAAWDAVPSHNHGGLQRYIENGIVPGDFLTAVLENNLMRALGRADEINRYRLFEIASFLYNVAPSQCYGSPHAVKEWSTLGGLNGIRAMNERAVAG